MLQFNKLRLQGFKSFVDRTELEIGVGLTGVVGPNGCGKSNLVEGLRWGMGESSTKRMRGGSRSMEDVIFNGTEHRPARNMAEVSILLDNSTHSAPAPYTTANEIEVVRKIERDHGSTYRINGKVVRARDVQLLYADIISGANSPFLVSQGKITDMINAKPKDRRMILEEAAGISGLHARRHEAELRLRATDNNLKRLEDMVGSMESRYQSLKKQARQANRYRNLSEEIRQLDLEISALEYLAAHNNLKAVQGTFNEAESKVAERLIVVTQLTKTQNVQSKDLPDLRHNDAKLMAALQTQKMALQRLEDEKTRLSTQIDEIKDQLEQLELDRTDSKTRLEDDTKSLERMNAEESVILKEQKEEDQELQGKETLKDELRAKVDAAEETYNTLMEDYVSRKAYRQSLENQISSDENKLTSLQNRVAQLSQTLEAKKESSADTISIEKLKIDVEAIEKSYQTQFGALKVLDEEITKLEEQKKQANELRQNSEREKYEIESQISSLEAIVNIYSEDQFKPIMDDISTDKGFETALSRALGDSLLGSLDEEAPVSWKTPAKAVDLPSLPNGVQPLKKFVKAPPELSLALEQIGVVDNDESGNKAWEELKPGQSIVSKQGTYWRWDGLVIQSKASDRHSVQLKQKNQLADLQKQLPAIEKSAEKAQSTFNAADTKLSSRITERDELKQKLERTDREARENRYKLNTTIEARSEMNAELAKLEEALHLAELDIKELAQSVNTQKQELGEMDEKSLDADEEKRQEAKNKLSALREQYQEALKNHDIAQQEQSRRKARVQAIGDERVNLQNRVIRGKERVKELSEREEDLKERLQALQERPKDIKIETEKLLDMITVKEAERAETSDTLTRLETELAETTKALKDAESLLAEAKETRAHSQATIEERMKNLDAIKLRINEQFDYTPEQLFAQAKIDQENLPELAPLKQKREQATRNRDSIGPVNLRADQEAEELEKELGTILTERSDLTEAIAELREAIQKLNSEAKERLNVAFEHVNGHFRTIFTRLFKGGKAHLSLIENEDPMESGLEIYAQPPGKTLQSLSLLSGGEQTLTALALIFAMFQTNPAPICVMDEVDAPLDDANVDRFCDLLEEYAEKGDTRFLIITHHRLTMARMDRLYGVTMTEKGVSKLVSVDLNQQIDFLEAAE